jgi:hypothetical protein
MANTSNDARVKDERCVLNAMEKIIGGGKVR